MSDLVAFLAARLEEDEAAAKTAHPGPWETQEETGLFGTVAHLCVMMPLGQHAGGRTGLTAYAPLGTQDAETARHIARHDPARVLREVAAKRALISQADASYMESDDYSNEQRVEAQISGAAILRALAAIYCDHQDYDPAWAAGQ